MPSAVMELGGDEIANWYSVIQRFRTLSDKEVTKELPEIWRRATCV